MKRPDVKFEETAKILDDMEAGIITPLQARMDIPEQERVAVIEYILCWEDENFCKE